MNLKDLLSFVVTWDTYYLTGEVESIKPPKITEWRETGSLEAGADVYSTGFGNVGKNIGYRVTQDSNPDMDSMQSRGYDQYILEHPNPRIEAQYTREDTGNKVIHTHPNTMTQEEYQEWLDEQRW
jgi:hypothetical protein